MNQKAVTLSLIAALISVAVAGAWATKKTLDQSVFDSWRQISSPRISDSGEWVIYELKPARGNGATISYNTSNSTCDTIHRATSSQLFGPAGEWIATIIKPTFDEQRQAKIKKLKDNKAPQDTIEIFKLGARASGIKVPLGKGFAVAERGDKVAYLRSIIPIKDTTASKAKADKGDTATTKVKADSTTSKSAADQKPKKFDRLVLWDVAQNDSITIDSVKSYRLSRGGEMLIYEIESDSAHAVGTYVNGKHTELFRSKTGKVAKLALDTKGEQGAYIVTTDTVDHAAYKLYYFDTKTMVPQQIAAQAAQNGYVVSRYGQLQFSPENAGNGHRLEFAMAPPVKEIPKDTLPADEKFSLDLWSWSDTLLMTQQIAGAKKLRETSYMAAYYPTSKQWSLMEDYNLSNVTFATEPDAKYALGQDGNPYEWASTWESPSPKDLYVIDLATNSRRLVKKGVVTRASLSPSSRYIVYYAPESDSWMSIESATGRESNLTGSIPHRMNQLDFDNPTFPPAEGMAGWVKSAPTNGSRNAAKAKLKQPDALIVYDNFDMWLLDASGTSAPKLLTKGIGRQDSTVLRYKNMDPHEREIDISKPMLITAFNKANRDAGLYVLAPNGEITKAVMGNHKYTFTAKARNADKVIWQRENFNDYRDLWSSKLDFKNPERISEANPQQKDYKWGSVKIVEWEDMNGVPTEGLLYLPDNYDSTKRYPTIVYFYERHTDGLNNHLHPQPSWSIVIPSVCTSQDYVVFMPDIRYKIGYPGQSCYDAVVSGSKMLIDRGVADPRRIGLQGQSWGGYQIAYLVTRTNMFRCASPGAPVTNMTSAFGGIRWGSGMPRMFQYERGQSRIGGSLWEKPIEYIENSPLFFANKVTTPMLMRHDDADEAVPWYQGIEYFVALRRHGVPVWMLNYNNEPHNLKGYAAKMDWDRRMVQFFDYYLKDAPMPRWMRDGISITEKGVDQKYDFVE